ncbi:helix-turn-helix domain-containing protein [Patescibacteria group bacterium]|nr:helix-turn-helix domain-containing protein [Patescibacteria group bacterium]
MTENKKNQPAGGQTLSGFLKEKRQSKNLSLEKLSDITKIQMFSLEALENGQFEKLPPSVYRMGIFKRLAKILDIDEKEIMEMYNNETQVVETSADYNNIAKPKKENFRFVLTPKKSIAIFSAILLVSLFAYLWYQFDFLVGPPNLAINLKEDLITQEGTITLKGKTDSRVDLTINGENIYVSPNGDFSKDVSLADGINVIEVKVINSFGKTTKIIRQIFRQ